MMVVVDAPHFYAAIILEQGVVVEAAPILGWTIGKRRAWLRNYFTRKGWKARIVE